MEKRMNKKAQLTIFVIIAIVLVVILIILFYPRIRILITGPVATDYVAECAEEAAEEVLEKLRVQGGTLEPENYILYQNNKIEYACYTNEYYKKCVMQKPFLKQDVEKEIINYVEPRVKTCLASLKEQLESRGKSVSLQEAEVDVSIVPNSIMIIVNAPMTVVGDGTQKFDKFKGNIKSQLYDLIMLSSSISNYEARYGNADTLTFMLYYPDIRVEKIERDDGRVYVLTDKSTDEKFMFASRSIAWPSGYIS